ncbi:molybdopterin-dependent oxidoreductase, partial [Streptomyces albus]
GRDTAQIIEAAARGELSALVVGGVGIEDLPDPARARQALEAVDFLVSLELRPGPVTERADVVFPVSATAEKSGTFLNWEGRVRMFEAALKPDQMTRRHVQPDARVLHMLADALDVHLGLPDVRTIRAELDRLGRGRGSARLSAPLPGVRSLPQPGPGEAVLAGHRMLLDQGRLQEGDEALAGTRHPAPARLSAATAAEIGAADGDTLAVAGPRGEVRLPLRITEMPDRVVWLPLNTVGSGVAADTGAVPGDLVRIAPGSAGATGRDREEVEA